MHIVITYPYTLGIPGGSPLDCMNTARHLKAAGAEVTVLPVCTVTNSRYPRPPVPESQLGFEQDEQLRAKGIEVIRVPANPLHYWLDGLPVKQAVKAILAKKQVDAVLGWYQEAAFLPSLLRSNKVIFGMIAAASYAPGKVPRFEQLLQDKNSRSTVGVIATYLYKSLLQSVRENFITANPLRQADVVFARSNFTGQEITQLFNVDKQRVRVSYCGINPLFAQAKRACTDEITRLIFYGWLVPQKGIFELLEALGRVLAQGQHKWVLKIAGWGDEDLVHQVACEHGISNHIELVGRLDHPVLIRQLEWANLAILPSHAESFGLAVAEAQAAGLPVIAYDVGAIPEVVEKNVTGWLVPPGRVELLAAAIIEAMQAPKRTLQMGLAGRERSTRLFSWPQTAQTMLQGIEDIKRKTSD